MSILDELEHIRTDETGDYDGDLPVRIYVHPGYDYLGWYEQLGGMFTGFGGSYWDDLRYISDSFGGEDLEDDIKLEAEGAEFQETLLI